MKAVELAAKRSAALAFSFGLLASGAAGAAPLGLSVGDVITSIEWDALMSNPPQGGFYSDASGLFTADGRVTSVDIAGPATLGQSGVDFEFDLEFLSEALDFSGFPPLVFSNISLGSPGGSVAGPDVIVRENGNVILFGNFSSLVSAVGSLNINNNQSEVVAIGRITVTGGDAALVNALGGAGVGQADILLAASIFNFDPDILSLLGDGTLFNSDFGVDLSGTLTPLNSAPFVPEPSTALLLGGGLIGLVAVTRRARR
jgi:hypothetical protein